MSAQRHISDAIRDANGLAVDAGILFTQLTRDGQKITSDQLQHLIAVARGALTHMIMAEHALKREAEGSDRRSEALPYGRQIQLGARAVESPPIFVTLRDRADEDDDDCPVCQGTGEGQHEGDGGCYACRPSARRRAEEL